jgi:hypothetical protein
LTSRQTTVRTTSTGEQIFSRHPAIRCIPAARDVINLEGYDIAATELAVDGEVEKSKIPSSTFNPELCPDGPDVLRAKWRLRPDELSLVPRDMLSGGSRDT